MKKLLALLLSLLLALGTIALAEDAAPAAPQATEEGAEAPESSEPVPEEETVEDGPSLAELAAAIPPAMIARTQNVVATVTADGQSYSLPLEDFNAVIALDTTQDPQLIVAAYQGNAPLALGKAQLSGDRLYFTVDGLYQTYEIEIPALKNAVDLDMPTLVTRVAMPGLLGLQLPSFGAITIPKMNFLPLIRPYATETATDQDGVTTTRFEISEEQMTGLIAQLSAALKATGQGGDMNAITAALDGYDPEKMEMIFSANGSVADSGTTQVATFNLFVKVDGEIADTPTAVLKAETSLNDTRLTLSLPNESEMYDIAQASLSSDAETDSSTLSFEALHALDGHLSLKREEGGVSSIECVYQADFLNQLTDINIIYGRLGDTGFTTVMGRLSGYGNFEFTATGMPESETAYVGTFSYNANRNGVAIAVTGEYRQALGQMDVFYELPSDTVPIDHLDIGAIGSVLTPLADYFTQHTTPPTPPQEETAEPQPEAVEPDAIDKDL